MPDQEDNMPNNKATLVDQRGEKTLHIEAEILPSGDLQISGHDLSPVLQAGSTPPPAQLSTPMIFGCQCVINL